MGQESSQMIDPDAPTRTLSSRSLKGIVEFINDGARKKIVVMTGAGISTSAGIPDFRSPDTGLYANLARLNLPYAEAVFDISYFREHPEPFYVLAKELYPGKFFPTISHSFVALLEEKHMLRMLFTQNIDCLERHAGVPGKRIVEAHGSFATQRCIECKTEYPDDLMMEAIMSGHVPHCIVPQCNGLVKPDIVFFGEQLPEEFHRNRGVPAEADLVIVMGTSLSVQPFASLPGFAEEGVPRILINKEAVGDLGSRSDDVLVLGDCDEGVRKLADALGWRDELEAMWSQVNGKAKKDEKAQRLLGERNAMSKDELLEAEIHKLTGEVDQALKISKDHTDSVNEKLSSSTKASIASTPALATPDTESSIDTPPKETALLSSNSEVPIQNDLGWKEPHSTPTVSITDVEDAALKREIPEVISSERPLSKTVAALDMTLPQNKPLAESIKDPETSLSKI